MERVYAADLLVLASPLYWYGPSAQLKALIDRWSCLLDREEGPFRERMRGKHVAVVLAQGERGFYEAGPCLQMLEWTESAAPMVWHGWTTPVRRGWAPAHHVDRRGQASSSAQASPRPRSRACRMGS